MAAGGRALLQLETKAASEMGCTEGTYSKRMKATRRMRDWKMEDGHGFLV